MIDFTELFKCWAAAAFASWENINTVITRRIQNKSLWLLVFRSFWLRKKKETKNKLLNLNI